MITVYACFRIGGAGQRGSISVPLAMAGSVDINLDSWYHVDVSQDIYWSDRITTLNMLYADGG